MKKLSDLFDGAVADNVRGALGLTAIWREIVGDTMADISMPLKMDGSLLVVGVTDSVWMSEISFMKDDIIERLQEHKTPITNIRFMFLPKKIRKPEPPLRRRTITEKEHTFINRLSASIENDELRKHYKSALTAYFTIHDLNEFLSSQ